MPKPQREIECYLNNETLKDLIAVYLSNVGVVRHNEEITDLELTMPDSNGIRTIRFKFEPLTQIIHHG